MDRSESFRKLQKSLQNAQDPLKAVTDLQEENQQLQKQVQQLTRDKAKHLKNDLKEAVTTINGIHFLAREIDLDAAAQKDLAFEMGNEIENLFMLFGSRSDDKALLTCYISKELAEERQLHAGKIVKELGKYIQGGGGGQPFFATAGGKHPAGIPEALENAVAYIAGQ